MQLFSLSIVPIEVEGIEVDGAVNIDDDVPGGLDPVELGLVIVQDRVQDLHSLQPIK